MMSPEHLFSGDNLPPRQVVLFLRNSWSCLLGSRLL